MKIIISRKGYDDKYGGKPSIILPDSNEMISFPIPVTGEKGVPSSNVNYVGKTLEDYFIELGHKKTKLNHHIDPDIGKDSTKKIGAFGQSGSALGHLLSIKNGKTCVTKGDIFLFFGTFCQTYLLNNKLNYEPMIPFHAIWGFLEVDDIIDPHNIPLNYSSELANHPHYLNRNKIKYKNGNSIFVGKNFGTFKYCEKLRLSKLGYQKTCWSLPAFFKQLSMTYNSFTPYGHVVEDRYETKTASIGQEFIVDIDVRENLEAVNWVNDIITTCI